MTSYSQKVIYSILKKTEILYNMMYTIRKTVLNKVTNICSLLGVFLVMFVFTKIVLSFYL